MLLGNEHKKWGESIQGMMIQKKDISVLKYPEIENEFLPSDTTANNVLCTVKPVLSSLSKIEKIEKTKVLK